MKHAKKLLAMFLVAATVTLSGCKDDEPTQPEQPPQQPQGNVELAGSSWESNLESDYTYQGVTMHVDLLSMLDFTDQTNGEIFMDLTVTVPAIPSYPPQQNSMTEPFTYTVDGVNIVMTGTYVDEETGETETYNYTAVYDANAETITLDLDDEEMTAIIGTDIIVFTRVR